MGNARRASPDSTPAWPHEFSDCNMEIHPAAGEEAAAKALIHFFPSSVVFPPFHIAAEMDNWTGRGVGGEVADVPYPEVEKNQSSSPFP